MQNLHTQWARRGQARQASNIPNVTLASDDDKNNKSHRKVMITDPRHSPPTWLLYLHFQPACHSLNIHYANFYIFWHRISLWPFLVGARDLCSWLFTGQAPDPIDTIDLLVRTPRPVQTTTKSLNPSIVRPWHSATEYQIILFMSERSPVTRRCPDRHK